MRIRTCLLLALGTGLIGLGLRVVLPVTPVDEQFRDVVRFYETLELPPK